MTNDDPFSEGKTIIGLNLLKMIDWANESSNILDGSSAPEDKLIIALPPVQRSTVWRPKQVVDLWDSLIRGLPIGTFYLVKRAKGLRKLVTLKGDTRELSLPGYDLLDGHQRIRALLIGAIGFPEEKRCLWIDLGNEEASRRAVLRITSKGQPFGYDAKTGNKLNLDERQRAREQIERNIPLLHKERRAYDRELFEDEVTQGGNPILQPPLPYGASEYTFKLPALLKVWREHVPICADEGIAALRRVVADGPSREALISLHCAFERIQKAEVALLCVDPRSFSREEDLLKLFDRIGAGGTPLSVEERLFSIYKYHVPDIRDTVNQIHSQAGHVLSPTKIAATAIRIAYSQSHLDRNDTPDVATFSRIMVDQKEEAFQGYLKRLIPTGSQETDEKGSLLRSFQTIKALLWYGEGVGPFWIPEVLLVSLPAELWQVLTYWAVNHPNSGNSKLSREEAVRFALFWHLTVWNNEKAARWAFAQIKKNKEAVDFPGASLYEVFTGNAEDRCAYKLIAPEEFERRLCKEESACWRTDAERFVENGIRNELGSHWWWNGKKMLPWLQKDYIRSVFQDYVPLTDHEDDVPYDVDHMCPSKDWRDHWTNLRHRLDIQDETLVMRVYECRDAVGDGIGNLQLLDSSENRARQDDDVRVKMPFILCDDQPPATGDAKAMANFAFAPENRELWRRVSRLGKVGERRWNEDRLKAFQQAVEKRAAWLYQRFHDDLGYGSWTKEKQI
jgi:hypothetical protein